MSNTLGIRQKLALTTSIALALSVGGFNAAVAQDEEEKSSTNVLLEEIEVYGTKRKGAEAAQNVPSQIAAYGTAQLEALQVIQLTDLAMITPNVALDDIGTARGYMNFTIRGQGINSSIPSLDPAVGLFVDGVYVGYSGGSITDMFDLEAIEIHKGPQGVLFGRNVTGGAVYLRTARPTGETNIKGRIGYGSGDQKILSVSAQTALTDTLFVKWTTHYNKDEGYFTNSNTGEKMGQMEDFFIRPTIKFVPSDSFETTVIYEYGTVKGDGAIAQNSAAGDPGNPYENLDTVIDYPGYTDNERHNLAIESIVQAGEGTITNIFGYREMDQKSGVDVDATSLRLFNAEITGKFNQISNEIRYNVPVSDKSDLTVGAFYYESELDYDESRDLLFGSARYGGGGVQDHKAIGFFINNDFTVTESFTIRAGARYSDEEKSVTVWPLGVCTYQQICPEGNKGESSWDFWSFKFGGDWVVSDDVKTYAHYARSYRAGGYNFRSPLPNLEAFEPERVDSVEIGFKSRLADNRIRLNGALFYNVIDDMQREINLPSDTGGVFQDIRNTAKGEVKGLEVDLVAAVTEQLTINASLGLLDGEYTEITADLTNDGVIDDADLALEIPRLASTSLNFGVNYVIPVGEGKVTARASYGYRSAAPYSDNNVGYFNDYTDINVGLTYEPAGGNWELAVYGKNLDNKPVLGGMTVLPFASFGGSYFAPMGKGATWGAELRFNF